MVEADALDAALRGHGALAIGNAPVRPPEAVPVQGAADVLAADVGSCTLTLLSSDSAAGLYTIEVTAPEVDLALNSRLRVGKLVSPWRNGPTMTTNPDIRALVERFTSDIVEITKRASLEDMHAKLASVLGETAPKRRGPGRSKGSTNRTAKRGRPGKFTPEQLEKHGASILSLLKKSPGARSEQLSTAMKMDAATLRIPLKALIVAKKIKVKGQKRGTTYFAR
jgi:hypothetical protein